MPAKKKTKNKPKKSTKLNQFATKLKFNNFPTYRSDESNEQNVFI